MSARTEPGAGAKQQRTRWQHRLAAWVRHHRHSSSGSLQRVLDEPLGSLFTVLVIGIALALPAAFLVATVNLERVSDRFDVVSRLSLFLTPELAEGEARALAGQLAARADVDVVVFRSREEALAEFREASGFEDILDGLEGNPLPHLLLVTPAAGVPAETVAQRLRDHPAVERMVLDSEWVQRLTAVLGLARRLAWIVGLLLALTVVLVVGNTIRLAVESRREEIIVTRLVGGSDAFVRRPFLYTGLWYGAGGGLVAASVVAMILLAMSAPVRAILDAYGSEPALTAPGLLDGLALVLLGAVLGLAGAWIAVAGHLQETLPAGPRKPS